MMRKISKSSDIARAFPASDAVGDHRDRPTSGQQLAYCNEVQSGIASCTTSPLLAGSVLQYGPAVIAGTLPFRCLGFWTGLYVEGPLTGQLGPVSETKTVGGAVRPC